MKRFEKKMKQFSKDSNPNTEDWLKAQTENNVLIPQTYEAAAKRSAFKIVFPVFLVICCVSLLLFIKFKPVEQPQYGEEELTYRALSLEQVGNLDLTLPDITVLKDVCFLGAYVEKTNELGYIRVTGYYENETHYTEYSVLMLLMNNVHFLSRSSYESLCTDPVEIDDYTVFWRDLGLIDDTFYTANIYGEICSKKYYIEIRSLSEITPLDFSLLFP